MAEKVEKKNHYSVLNCDVVAGIMSLLDALNGTARGRVIYQQVEHAIRDLTVSQNKIAYGYAHILNLILDSYRKHLPKDSLLYLELKLVEKRLMPPISLNELAVLHGYVRNVMNLTKDVLEPDEALIREAMLPLMGEEEPDNQLTTETTDSQQAAEQIRKMRADDETQSIKITSESMTPSVEMHVNSVFQQRLNKHYREIQHLQSSLSEKIDRTSEQYQNFGLAVKNTIHKLEKATNLDSIEATKRDLLVNIKTLLNNQMDLANILTDTQAYLAMINENSQKLSEELDQVRVLSLTDDLTGLPNRRAFLRRAEDEMGRADRDKTSLALVAIDLDYFKDVNDKYGHTVGDEILKKYAKEVLSVFRRYDMVSRYGGEEFSVLLPNTDKDGALRALNKIQAKASTTHYEHNGDYIGLPTFSCGLVIHRPGETMQKFIERADNVLYKAKQMGRNRVEIDESYLGEPTESEKQEADKEQIPQPQ
ncbi:MAG: diguanylate cyclase [Thioalkalispiraceae bacterium]|jgi:diguanylate cyclase (GGDEF)-like protein